MRRLILFFLIFLCGNASAQEHTKSVFKNEVFNLGEELTFKITLLGFNVGQMVTKVDKTHHKLLGKQCYKVDGLANTSDWISWVSKVNDTWTGYMDTTHFLTRASSRNIREGRYKKDEWVTYDQELKKASVQVVDKKTGKYKEAKHYDMPQNATDLVGGFMYLRFLDYDKAKKGDTLRINGFFEDAGYTLKIIYKGKDFVKTKVGKIPCHLLAPVMPNNSLFDGKNSISIWISDDKNKIPVKISAKMFIGHAGIELTNFKGLKNSLKIQY